MKLKRKVPRECKREQQALITSSKEEKWSYEALETKGSEIK
jgi:hypothetical protein